uniref:V-type proton ATPase subunit a n=1 Tax=Panagrolaimus sp. JU765 TaxID=591449 RepID=A0AC34QSB6_9BILA
MMGAIHRSEEISLAQIYLHNEAAYNCVAELGELGLVQFRDLNKEVSPFQRKYVTEIRRCDEMERKLRYLEDEIKRDSIPILDTGEDPEAPQPREMSDMEATFEKLEHELREVNQNEEMLKKNFAELTELKHILRKTQTFFEEDDLLSKCSSTTVSDLNTLDMEQLPEKTASLPIILNALGFVAGIIQREHVPGFERFLWRACRGNVYLHQAEITESLNDPVSGLPVNKVVFVVFFQGDQLKSRVKKICEGFHASLYPCPDTPQERREMSIGVMTRIEDLKTVLGQTQDHRHRVLVAAAKNIRMWMTKVRKIKAIYYTLNMCNVDVTQKCLIAEVWFPTLEQDRIQMALKRGSDESGSTLPSILHVMQNVKETYPTYNKTNKFTRAFQNIVDSYGIASYREINPAPYTMITFPFLFALMFGDMGHGCIMMMFGLYLVLCEKQLEAANIRDDIFQTFFGGRYLIFLMGLFSIYTGFIYNDAFSKSFNIFGSAWRNPFDPNGLEELVRTNPERMLTFPVNVSYDGEPYTIGVDPIWNLAETNKLNFLNSLKMKASVIIGISQMAFGLVLSYHNHKFFGSRLDIIYVFIPQMLFLCSIFVYLCVQIIVKWIVFDSAGGYKVFGYDYPGAGCAPALLIGLINMFMMKSRPAGFDEGTCYLNTWYPGQSFFESVFLLIAIICIPVMLFAKPYFQYKEHKMRLASGVESEFDLGDTMVYQAIHTIEFALGCISHTASYLRLWALSLAHAQLSDVLWTMVFRHAFALDGYEGAVATYVIFFIFASLTLAILVLMEGLSAFLHALRLHWVEFQSKFFSGSGYAFQPFSFQQILDEARFADMSN